MPVILPPEQFRSVVELTPLISIDFIIENNLGEILLGYRTNRPARNTWFVPGGRIGKDETMVQAFSRLSLAELGVDVSLSDAQFLGVYEHFYPDNFSGTDFSTHYIVLGYRFRLDLDIPALPKEQHTQYRWFSVDELMLAEDVHPNTKRYFQ